MNYEPILQKLSGIFQKSPTEIQAAEDFFNLIGSLLLEEPDKAREYNKTLLPHTERCLREESDMKRLERYFALRKKSLLVDAPICFDSYLQYLEWDREREKRFYMPRRKVLKSVVDEMQRLDDDELDLLTVSLPPGSGKTTLGIFFLTWIMGKYPLQPNLASAHSDKLTRSFYDGVLSVLNDPDYLWNDVFPTVRLIGTNAKDESIDLDKPKRFKTLTCRSIDGSLTGATRCERTLYADDLVSGVEEALSKPRMDSLWEKYTNDLKSRKKQGCKEIHISTRWSIHDPVGRLERQYGSDPRAKFISVPALDANEESNFDYSGGVGFDRNYFLDMRDTLDDVSWRCLFQQEPIEREGILYHEDDLRRYFDLPIGEPDAIIAVVDTKDRGADYAVLPVGYIYGNDHYIEDCICDNGLPETVDARLTEILMRHKVKMCRFESNSAGGRIAEKIQDEIKAKGGITHITTRFTTANKETKIIINSAWVKEHCLFKDSNCYRKDSDYGRLMNFLCAYTVSGKNKHDDAPDALSMYAEFAQSFGSNQAAVFKRPF